MEQPPVLRFGPNLVPSWEKGLFMHFCGSAWRLGFMGWQTPALPAGYRILPPRPCVKQRGRPWWRFRGLPVPTALLLGGHRHLLSQARIAPPRRAQPRRHGPSEPRASPSGKTSRVYLPSKVKSGRDRWRKALTREIPFGGEQRMHKVLKPSLMPHHPTSPAITPRRSRLGLVPLPRATHTCPLTAPGCLQQMSLR